MCFHIILKGMKSINKPSYLGIGVRSHRLYIDLIIMLSLSFLCVLNVSAATIPSETCEYDAVVTALSDASSGDIVIVPQGTCTWDTGIDIPEGVKLIGAGIENTIINSSSFIRNFVNDNSWAEGIKFNNGVIVPYIGYPYTTHGGLHNWVIKDCYFRNNSGSEMMFVITSLGKTEHQTGVYHGCTFYNMMFKIAGEAYGIEEWAYPDDLGGIDNVVYFEGNTFNGYFFGDHEYGGKAVWRFNTFNNGWMQTHGAREGLDSTSNKRRAARKVEVYRNNFVKPTDYSWQATFWNRGGVTTMFDNNCTGNAERCLYLIDTERVISGSAHGTCAADNGFDINPHPKTGDSFGCRDAIGMGQDVNPPSPSITSYPLTDQHDQRYSPSYYWNNEYNGSTGNFYAHNNAQNYIIENRDYFLDASSASNFGLGGVSSGLLSNAPVCNASREYYGYWATDKGGNWNTTSEWNGDDGALYQCQYHDGTYSWVLYYTPAQYPHPLVQSGSQDVTERPGAPLDLTKK